MLFAAAPVTGAVEATAIMTPATIATMPPMAPPASPRMVQVEVGGIPDLGPSPVNGVPLCGMDWQERHPFPVRFSRAAAQQDYPACSGQTQPGQLPGEPISSAAT